MIFRLDPALRRIAGKLRSAAAAERERWTAPRSHLREAFA